MLGLRVNVATSVAPAAARALTASGSGTTRARRPAAAQAARAIFVPQSIGAVVEEVDAGPPLPLRLHPSPTVDHGRQALTQVLNVHQAEALLAEPRPEDEPEPRHPEELRHRLLVARAVTSQ